MIIKSINKMLGVLNSIATICIIIMMVSTVADVTGRYLANSPILGMTELNRTLLVVVAFLALGYAQLRRQHIRVELLLNRLPSKPRILVDGLDLLLALVVMSFITYGSAIAAYEATITGEYETGIISFPMWPGRIALALGCLMLCIQFAVQLIDNFYSSLRK